MVIGNGKGLNIKHVSFGQFTTKDITLAMNTILHFLHIAKNLMSVSQFTCDNNVYFEFHANSCCVKDLQTIVFF